MHVEHFEKGVRYSDRDLLILAKMIGKLATRCRRLKDEGSSIRVETEERDTKKERDSVKAMITVRLPGKIIRAESRKSDAIEAVARCVEKLEPQIALYKDSRTNSSRVRMLRHKRRVG